MNDISQNLISVRNRIHGYAEEFMRLPRSVSLLVVSKGQSFTAIQQAVAAGQTVFGENYLQEALVKINALKAHNLQWHFIGSLQTKKAKKIAENFDWVHSVSSIEMAERLNQFRPSHWPLLNICLQINISQEPSKSGIAPEKAECLAEQCAALPHLKLRGLMAVPRQHEDFASQRVEFNKLAFLFEELKQKNFTLDTLSIGMSHDLRAAIAAGATLVRVGTAVFGPRNL